MQLPSDPVTVNGEQAADTIAVQTMRGEKVQRASSRKPGNLLDGSRVKTSVQSLQPEFPLEILIMECRKAEPEFIELCSRLNGRDSSDSFAWCIRTLYYRRNQVTVHWVVRNSYRTRIGSEGKYPLQSER